MIKVNIIEVLKGPQTEEPFDGGNGIIHYQAWLCEVEADGVTETAKIKVGHKDPDDCKNAKYIRNGGVIIANKRYVHDNRANYNVNSAATKEENGDGYQTSGGGGGQGQPSEGRSSSAGGQPTTNLYNDIGMSAEGLRDLASDLKVAARLIIAKFGSESSDMNDNMRAQLGESRKMEEEPEMEDDENLPF